MNLPWKASPPPALHPPGGVLLLIPVLVVGSFVSVPQESRPGRVEIRAAAADGCSTSECHTDYRGLRFAHGPVALGMCLSCHTIDEGSTPYESGDDHMFDVIERDGRLCARCHESKVNEVHVHYPMELNRCLACHDPHGSNNPGLVRHEEMAENCYECHEAEMDDDDVIHAPVRAGACTLCHDPHGSPNPRALVAPGPKLCFRCHTDIAERIEVSRHAHRPVMEKCTLCHSPHDAYYPMLLNEEVPDLCIGCHEDMGTHITDATHPHGALDNEASCLTCHDPHAADYSMQLRKEPIDLCLGCHGEELVAKDRVLRNMSAFLEANPDHHGPIRNGDCSACHDPHGSQNPRILRKPYPKNFYAPFELESYGLCFSCHESSLVLDLETETLTGYRNGNMNLHFVHVNREKKGRTCRTCHDVHASRHPKHIADSVPFGTWRLPIAFEKLEDGGRCSPGCHKPRSYSRLEAVENH